MHQMYKLQINYYIDLEQKIIDNYMNYYSLK